MTSTTSSQTTSSNTGDAVPTDDRPERPADQTQQIERPDGAGQQTGGPQPDRERSAAPSEQARRRMSGGSMLIDPAMIASALAGVYLLVSGIVALARAGLTDATLFGPEVTVGGLVHTPLLGLIEIGFGLLVLAAGTLARSGSAVTFLGVLALIVGLVWVIEAGAFQQWLGVTAANGWQHIIMGVVLAVAGQVSPFRLDRSEAG